MIYFSLGRRMRGNIGDSVDETGGECAWANGSIWREERVAEVTLYVNRMDWFRFSNSRRFVLEKKGDSKRGCELIKWSKN